MKEQITLKAVITELEYQTEDQAKIISELSAMAIKDGELIAELEAVNCQLRAACKVALKRLEAIRESNMILHCNIVISQLRAVMAEQETKAKK